MATLAQARSQWVSDNPISSINPPVNQSDYDAMADDRAAILLAQLNGEEAAAAAALDRQQFIAGMTNLRTDLSAAQTAINTNSPLTAAQIRVGFRDVITSLLWIGDHIADGTIVTRK